MRKENKTPILQKYRNGLINVSWLVNRLCFKIFARTSKNFINKIFDHVVSDMSLTQY